VVGNAVVDDDIVLEILVALDVEVVEIKVVLPSSVEEDETVV